MTVGQIKSEISKLQKQLKSEENRIAHKSSLSIGIYCKSKDDFNNLVIGKIVNIIEDEDYYDCICNELYIEDNEICHTNNQSRYANELECIQKVEFDELFSNMISVVTKQFE